MLKPPLKGASVWHSEIPIGLMYLLEPRYAFPPSHNRMSIPYDYGYSLFPERKTDKLSSYFPVTRRPGLLLPAPAPCGISCVVVARRGNVGRPKHTENAKLVGDIHDTRPKA